MKKLIILFVILFSIISCKKTEEVSPTFTETKINLTTHSLTTYSVINNSKYLVIFESGLGNDHTIWQTMKVAESASQKIDVVIYDRAGYGKSTIDNNPRNIDRLRIELEAVVNKFANGRKVILVGHSWGGLVIRDFAIKNPTKTAALLFIDASHEKYNVASQSIEDLIVSSFSSTEVGGMREAKEIVEGLTYVAKLPNLPNVPVMALTSMKKDDANNSADQIYKKTRQDLFNAHESLKNGVTDFTHIGTDKSGHFIMTDEPTLVIDKLNVLIAKLP
jgi:triacylglycerol esterase/lipase EstA (alpha/beta hydrolase family)